MRRTEDERNIELGTAFFHGWISSKIEDFAQRLQIPASQLAGRLAELLSGETQRETLGVVHHLPRVQRAPAQADQVLEPVALADGPHSDQAQEAVSRKRGPRGWWAKLTKEQRSAEMKRQMKKWSPDAKLRWRHKGRVPEQFSPPKLPR
jgi:hypothetical protein